MGFSFAQLLEGTFAAVVIYIIVTNGTQFSQILAASGSTYAEGVSALQGNYKYTPPK
jgi:hypothetical protein